MKKLYITTTLIIFSIILNAQVNSLPGTFQWSMNAAWDQGFPPTPGQVVNITSNSTVDVDSPLTHDGDVNVLAGGFLTCSNPTNSLTLNSANLTNNSQINFTISGPAPITINNGHFFNNVGVCMSGDMYILWTLIGGSSINNGDLMITGNLTIDGAETFDNNLGAQVSGATTVNSNCIFNNNQTLMGNSIHDNGTVNNFGFITMTDSIIVADTAVLNSTGGTIDVSASVKNEGMININDSMEIGTDLINTGTFTNTGGGVDILTSFYNNGTITGSGNGSYNIFSNSENDVSGIINGDIDVCDATLIGPAYLDIDNGTVDFGTVTFCTQIITGINSESLEANYVIYPNPSLGIFTLDGMKDSKIELISIDGKLILEEKLLEDSYVLNLTQLPKGIYFLQQITTTGTAIHKLVKQ